MEIGDKTNESNKMKFKFQFRNKCNGCNNDQDLLAVIQGWK